MNASSFVNPVVNVADIPRLEEARFEPVDASFLWVAWLTKASMAGAALSVLVALWFFGIPGRWLVVVAGGVLLAALGSGLLKWLEVERMGYLVREHDVSFRSGFLLRSVETIPFSRVQNVSLERGPLNNIFGLSELTIQTAGGQLFILGLADEQATAVKAMIVDRAYLAAESEHSAFAG